MGKLTCDPSHFVTRCMHLCSLSAVFLCDTSFTLLTCRAGHLRIQRLSLYTIINLHFNETSLCIHQCLSISNSNLDPKMFIVDIETENPFSDCRSLEIHNCAQMSSWQRRRQGTNTRRSGPLSGDQVVLIFTHSAPKEHRNTIGPKLLQQFPEGSPQ